MASRTFTRKGETQLSTISYRLSTASLFLIRRYFGQRRRQQTFLLFFLRVKGKPGRRDHTRSDENDQVLFSVLLSVGAKRSTDERNVAEDGSLIFDLLYVFAHQPAEHHCLPIINTDARGHFARAEDRLVDHVLSEQDWRRNRYSVGSPHRVDTHCIDWAAIIDEALELDDLR